MGVILITSLLSLVISSCGGNSNMFRLEGHFKNLNGGEFYIYDINDGWKDTIVIQNGDFTYERAMEDTTTLILLFPNYSELPILARAGVEIDIEGDASHLRETEVSGDEANDLLTEFRQKISDLSATQAQDEARRFIKEHPASPACHYVLHRFFLLSPSPDYAEASRLCSDIIKAQPGNRKLLRLRNMLASFKDRDLQQLPEFTTVHVTYQHHPVMGQLELRLTKHRTPAAPEAEGRPRQDSRRHHRPRCLVIREQDLPGTRQHHVA